MAFFTNDFRKEDLFIYFVIFGLMGACFFFFYESFERLEQQVVAPKVASEDVRYQALLEYHAMRYNFTGNALISNASRSYMGFFLGTILCLLGAMIVIRRLRTEPTELGTGESLGGFKIRSSSPGLIIASLGTIIIVASLIWKDKYNITDSFDAAAASRFETKVEKPYYEEVKTTKKKEDEKEIEPF